MASTKGQGSTRNGRDSAGQRLGIKTFAGEIVRGGAILIRQRGNRFWPGINVGEGRDNTLFARTSGRVVFEGNGSRKRVSVHSLTS